MSIVEEILGLHEFDYFSEHLPPVLAKAISLHIMKALGGRGNIAPTHSRPWH
jgi:hypothetical protein